MHLNCPAASFWSRSLATLIDTLFLLLILTPLIIWWHGWQALAQAPIQFSPVEQFLINGLPLLATLAFWHYQAATPGKRILSLRVVDQKTGSTPSWRQCWLRLAGYFVSTLPFGLGFLWIFLNPQRLAWHDALSGTAVIVQRFKKA